MGSLVLFLKMSFCCILCAWSCTKEPAVDLVEVRAVLYAGQSINHIEILKYTSEGAAFSETPITDAQVSIQTSDTNLILAHLPYMPGTYSAPPNFRVKHSSTYQLSIVWKGTHVSAEAFIPPPPVIQAMPNNQIIVYQPFEGGSYSSSLLLSWDKTTAYNTFSVESREENPEKVELMNQELVDILTQEWLESVTNYSNTSLTAGKLQYYGTSVVKVWSLSNTLAEIMMAADTWPQAYYTPSNIQNGIGYFTGLSCDSLEVEVIKE
jgi:hypothetical protein